MEDRHIVSSRAGGNPNASLYAVFDGHSGARTAEFCVQHMPRILDRLLAECMGPALPGQSYGKVDKSAVPRILAKTFRTVDKYV